MNLLSATLVEVDGALRARFGDQRVAVPDSYRSSHDLAGRAGGRVVLGLRPEDLTLGAGDAGASLDTTVDVREALGSEKLAYLSFTGQTDIVETGADVAEGEPTRRRSRLVARLGARAEVAEGERVTISLNPSHLHFFDPDTGATLRRAPGAP